MEKKTKEKKKAYSDDELWREQILKKIRRVQASFFTIITILLLLEWKRLSYLRSAISRHNVEEAISISSVSLTNLKEKVSLLDKEQNLMKKVSMEQQESLTMKITKIMDEMEKLKLMSSDRNIGRMQIEHEQMNPENDFDELKPIQKFGFESERKLQVVVKTNWDNRKLQEKHCHKKPILHPFNDITGNVYDQRVAGLLDVFQSISSYSTIHDCGTPQYKAACFILYDDENKMPTENEFTVERYVLHLFLSSINHPLNGKEFPDNVCDIEDISCDRKGHITKIMFGMYNKKKLFDLFIMIPW